MSEASYDPWDDIDAALDAGTDPTEAHDRSRSEALAWHIAVSAESRVVYLSDYEKLREKRKRDRAVYMREYRRRKPAA